MTVDTKIQYSRMAGRLIDHVANGTTDWAEGTMEVPSTEYTDAEQWQREMDCIFKSLPILVGVTQEIPNPGDFRTLEILGIPLLITRQKDGTAKVLMNVCTQSPVATKNYSAAPITVGPSNRMAHCAPLPTRRSLATCVRGPVIWCSSPVTKRAD